MSASTLTSDPAQPSNPNSDHTKTDGSKPATAISAIIDPDFPPTLDGAPTPQRLKSHLLLLCLIIGGVFSAWLMGFELFQVSAHQSWGVLASGLAAVVALGGLGMYLTGGYYIDWWELVAGYWWLSMPVAGAAGLLLVMAQEQSSDWYEVD